MEGIALMDRCTICFAPAWRARAILTDYIIHPEEILAENFVHMVMREANLPSPEIVHAIETSLRGRTVP